MRRLAWSLALVPVLAGCTDIISPPRVAPYEYRLQVVEGEETYQLAFHWPRASLPVKVWVAGDDPLRPMVIRALDIWEDAFLYGEFRAVLVDDAAGADVIVRNQISPAFSRTGSIRLEAALAPECRGATDFDADPVAGTLQLPFQVYVWSRIGPDGAGLATCYEITTLHEIGHALGLFMHSGQVDDLMYGDPTRNGLSDRDRATVEAAYHLPTTVAPVR